MPPYLSVCLASRNDDYSGNMMDKRQWCLDVMLAHAEAYALPMEIIFTDWNPPADRPPLHEVLRVPASSRYVTLRVITAPAWCHTLTRDAEVFQFNLIRGFNAALLRARGDFVVCKCTDVIWSQAVWAFLGGRNLDPACIYRSQRNDVSPHPLDLSPGEAAAIDAWCRDHTVRANAPGTQTMGGLPLLFTNACGDFQMLSRQAMFELRGYYEDTRACVLYCDGYLAYAAYRMGLREHILDGPIYKLLHGQTYATRVEDRDGKRFVRGIEFPPYSSYIERVQRLLREKHGHILNAIHWGLGDLELEEHVLCRAQWDRLDAVATA